MGMIWLVAEYRTLFRVFCGKNHLKYNKTIKSCVTIVNIDARHFVKCKAKKKWVQKQQQFIEVLLEQFKLREKHLLLQRVFQIEFVQV
jgi:hypothetical protein